MFPTRWGLGLVALTLSTLTLSTATVAIATVAAAAGSAGSVVSTAAPSAQVVVTFPPAQFGTFAESMVADHAGNLFVSVTSWTAVGWNSAQVWKVTPSGSRSRFGPRIDVGILSGLALDSREQLYAGLVAWQDPSLPDLDPGVLRITSREATRVLTLPNGPLDGSGEPGAFPNGLAFSGETLYVSDSKHGSIWRTQPRHGVVDTPRHPWLTSSLLAPVQGWEGINGIAVLTATDGRRSIDAVNADTGTVVRIPIQRNGDAGAAFVRAADPALVTGDGVTFDRSGTLWVVANGGDSATGRLLRVSPSGRVSTVADNPSWLDYPSQPVFGTTPRTADTLFIANGAYLSGASSVIAVTGLGR